ncbi:MAG: hypothetical protein ACI4GW_04800 [Lachnospiraceae bacterium]
MIIYISNKERIDLLDDIAEQYDWQLIKESVTQISLNDYIAKKMPVITDLQYLIIDRTCITEQDNLFQEVIDTIYSIWNVHIIIIEDQLVNEEGETVNVIEKDNMTLLTRHQESLLTNITYILKGEKIPSEDIYTGVWIGVMSANSGAGATHLAISLTNYIYNNNESVCYVEANESGDLPAMAEFYAMNKIEDNHYEKEGIEYWHQSIDPEKPFVVIDLGKYNSAKLNLFNQCKIKIIVSDGKPYRIADAKSVMKYIGDDKANLVFNFLEEKEFDQLVSFYQLNGNLYRLSWHENMFDGRDFVYADLLGDYISSPAKSSKFIIRPDKLRELMKRKGKKQPLQQSREALEDMPEDIFEAFISEDIVSEDTTEDIFINDTDEETEEQVPEIIPEYEITEPETDIPEDELDNIIPDEAVPEENPFDEPYVVAGKPKKNIVKMLLLFLVISGFSTYIIWPQLSGFFFNNRQQQNITTELVDENLNINPDIKISVLEVEGADGYEVSYSTDRSFPEEKTIVVEVETADKAVENLAANKTYYVRVRAYKYNEDGIKVYGDYTDVQEIDT